MFAGFVFVVLAGLTFVAFVEGVLAATGGAVFIGGVETTTGVAFAGLFVALLVFVSPPQAIPKALSIKSVESAIIFFMSFLVLLSFLKE